MKNFVKLFTGLALVSLFAACSQQSAEEPVATTPMETAEEFIARANAELTMLIGAEHPGFQHLRRWIFRQDCCERVAASCLAGFFSLQPRHGDFGGEPTVLESSVTQLSAKPSPPSIASPS